VLLARHRRDPQALVRVLREPKALRQVYRGLQDAAPPLCTLPALRGMRCALGEPPSANAPEHLEAALPWATDWLSQPKVLRHA
jgi:hypothetical protein